MISPVLAKQMGLLPIKRGKVRFAVGAPDGITSNSWVVEARKKGDVYISCRDNFKEAKVSLHASGRWRMGFTETAINEQGRLLRPGQNRAWDVWDKPNASLPNSIIAFRLLFLTTELAVRPEKRAEQDWKKVIYIEAAPPGLLTAVTLFITTNDVELTAQSEPSFCLASLEIGKNQRVQLIAHGEPEGNLPALIEAAVMEAQSQAKSQSIAVPPESYMYMLGRLSDDSRYLVGARVVR